MSLTNEPSNPFEKLLLDMLRDSGPKKSTTGQPAPVDSEQRKASASGMKNDWAPVVLVAVILGFMFAIAWLVITHVS